MSPRNPPSRKVPKAFITRGAAVGKLFDPMPDDRGVEWPAESGGSSGPPPSGDSMFCPSTWVNYSIHGPPTPPTPNPGIWPRTALGPISANRGHRGESIPPIHIQKCCNRTDFEPKNGLAHVCSSLPRYMGPHPPNSKCPNLAPHGPGTPKIGFLVCFS